MSLVTTLSARGTSFFMPIKYLVAVESGIARSKIRSNSSKARKDSISFTAKARKTAATS